MDRLWFHQIILFSDRTSLILPKILKQPEPVSETLSHLSSDISHEPPRLEEDQISSSTSAALTPSEDEKYNEDKKETKLKATKPRRSLSSIITSKSRSQLSSPLNQGHIKGGAVLTKTMSCKSFSELELEEVKGFMDLGFNFRKEQLSPRMMILVPGLQRLGLKMSSTEPEMKKDDNEGEGGSTVILRPYLSEAWLIKRPDSPLLNLRLPRVSAAADMKKHLRYWARTVASVIQQES
ncbi:uncharacterized protein LOC127788988 [Diospyros lotus]|uniref:uncharacterized protein LOC127788988 n=1 Tax=Diospyros lotus TaxID=55363 RepID=UPI00224E325C|nr:uncharacterized protein LOC127788988 [Diospyros lotus]